MNIRYVPYDSIDKQKWDKCVGEAPNGSVYVRSVYLDHMSRHWDGLVLDDYAAVFPLTWNRKWGIHYLYQPPLAATGGPISPKKIAPGMVDAFLDAIPPRFKFWDFNLNRESRAEHPMLYERMNFLLPLDKPYDVLKGGYDANTRRNLVKGAELSYVNDVTVEEVIKLDGQCDQETKERFLKLSTHLEKKIRAVRDAQGNLLASAVFLFSHQTAYYLLVGNHPEGRKQGASHRLIDGFIGEHAGQELTLDFEGSDIPGVARFYKGFGAKADPYTAIRLNRLPAPLKWLKR